MDCILENKCYTWDNFEIKFLENGLMNAFGTGKYKLTEPFIVQADFGMEKHRLTFNDDYTKFTSVREKDGDIIKGELINASNLNFVTIPELLNKTYSWDYGNCIKFLENGELDAFGKGNYIYLQPFVIQANFGLEVHKLTFNKDYTEFSSVREKDGEIIKGRLIEVYEIPELNYKQYLWNKNKKILFLSSNNLLIDNVCKYLCLSDKKISLQYNMNEYILTFNENYTKFESKNMSNLEILDGSKIEKSY